MADLLCPECRCALVAGGRAYTCPTGHVWPIRRGIPRFVPSEGYAGNFGFEWRRYKKTQLDRQGSLESTRRLVEKTGLRPEDVKGRRVLDVGVGTGRFADVVRRWGGDVTGIDLSLAVETARKNLPSGCLVAQADLFKLPFAEESFDIVYSIGVLHHTPDTFAAVKSIARYVKPGGTLAIWVYEKDIWTYYADIYRRWTPDMPQSLLHFLSNLAIPYYHFLEVVRLIPWIGERARERLLWYLFMPMHADPFWRVLDTYDWYSPRYQWKHTFEEVAGWFRELGFEDVERMPLWPTAVRGRAGTPGAA
ncbi:MAG: methyltransferase domain-containing protein [Planctomycetota bacterium]